MMALPYAPLLVSLLSTLLLSHLQPSASAACTAADQKALVSIKSFFKNPPSLSSWVPATDCCSWTGIICDSNTSRVTTLSIYNDPAISATIPPAIADLQSLQFITLGRLNLGGPITPVFARLADLVNIDLSHNALTGPIPTFLSSMTRLDFIDLSYNRLTGSIPPGLALLPRLVQLGLAGNLLSGPIPDSFGSFRSIYNLFLSRNMLTGPLPRSMGSVDFFQLDLSNNRISGDASFLFHRSDTRELQLVDLSNNTFEFDLSNVVFPLKLSYLYLNNNRIYGRIPQQIATLKVLKSLNVSYNMLCGQIPVGGRMGRFAQSSYSHNRCLCGTPLPPCK